MLSLPIAFRRVIGVFAPVFSRPVWQQVTVLLTGAILAPGSRTVAAILRLMGRSAAAAFQTDHRVLNRAVWSSLTARRLLLRLVVAVCIPRGVVVVGLDDTIARRRGEQRQAQGISRAPVRSSHTPFVKVSGLRWLCGLGLAPIAWANRVWALPLLTGLGPAERCYEHQSRRHQPLTARAWPMRRRVWRWVPGRASVCGAARRVAGLAWLAKVTMVPYARVSTRLRLDAAL
jgi:hypothetical protein